MGAALRYHCDSVGFCGATEELLPGLSLGRADLPEGALVRNGLMANAGCRRND
jgi:hypothetical protein